MCRLCSRERLALIASISFSGTRGNRYRSRFGRVPLCFQPRSPARSGRSLSPLVSTGGVRPSSAGRLLIVPASHVAMKSLVSALLPVSPSSPGPYISNPGGELRRDHPWQRLSAVPSMPKRCCSRPSSSQTSSTTGVEVRKDRYAHAALFLPAAQLCSHLCSRSVSTPIVLRRLPTPGSQQ
jgi:hypothetical protein